jgi:hypothetical protein
MYTGFAIAIAWPETLCKQAGAWYDGLMNILGFSKDNFYRVGHAAVVLVEIKTGNCFYFDFGRYHAPFGHGRVRDHETDHDLGMYSMAKFSDSRHELLNFEEILSELAENPACHGDGPLHASYTKIDFDKAFSHAKSMQQNCPIKYGPFILKGTNCSRFVRTIILNAKAPIIDRIKLFFPLSVSPSPIGNVKCLNKKMIVEKKGF